MSETLDRLFNYSSKLVFTYDARNQHGGVMPALPGDFELTGAQAAQILEKCAVAEGVSYDQVSGVSGMLKILVVCSILLYL